MKKDTKVSIAYSAAQALYWMTYAASVSFTAVYLQTLGLSNTGVGLVLGAGYVLGFLASNLLGSWVDRFKRFSASKTVTVALALEMLMLLYIIFFGTGNIFTVVIYGAFICLCMCVGGFITKQWADLTHSGYDINYGITRSIGSLGYASLGTLMGVVAERYGVTRIFPVALVTVALAEAVNLYLSRFADESRSVESSFVSGDGFFGFLLKNGRFCLMLVGIMLVFFSYKVTNDYMINMVSAVGGNAADVGALHAFGAALEIPVMMLYRRIAKRVRGKLLLTVAFVTFGIKVLAQSLAPSMGWHYAAMVLQCASYALYAPAIVDYVNETVEYKDSAKGQVTVNGMTVLAAVFSSFLGGMLLDRISVRNTLLVATAVSACGVVACLIALWGKKKEPACNNSVRIESAIK